MKKKKQTTPVKGEKGYGKKTWEPAHRKRLEGPTRQKHSR